jgi:hypothetical protein
MRNRGVLPAVFVGVLLAGLSPLAADVMIRRGVDTFTTTDNGKTGYDFSQTPIPAGFFCKGSRPFTGRVAFKGLPLATGAPGQLRNADTVIERLDDAVFDAQGRATTRLQFRALSLVSIAPLKTGCGAYHVYVSLADEQRVTTMYIDRTQEAGGKFSAPLAVNVRLTFIPVKPSKAAQKRELTGSFTFPATPIPWSFAAGIATKRVGSVRVDTNGDLAPDTLVAGSSNFFPGWSPNGLVEKWGGGGSCVTCEPESCHDDGTGKIHCSGPVLACNGSYCP